MLVLLGVSILDDVLYRCAAWFHCWRMQLLSAAPCPLLALQASERARSLRQSVNVNRFSRIALNNLERETEAADYAAAQATHAGDIHIESADAELDFEENGDEGAPGGLLTN